MPSNYNIHLVHLWDDQALPEHHVFIIQVAFHVWHCTLIGHDQYQQLFSSQTTHLLWNRHATYSTEHTEKNVKYSKVTEYIYIYIHCFYKTHYCYSNNTMHREVDHTESEGIHYVSGFQLSTTLAYTWTTFNHHEKQILHIDSILFQRNIKLTIFNRQNTWLMPFSNVGDTDLMNMSQQKCEHLKISDSWTSFEIIYDPSPKLTNRGSLATANKGMCSVLGLFVWMDYFWLASIMEWSCPTSWKLRIWRANWFSWVSQTCYSCSQFSSDKLCKYKSYNPVSLNTSSQPLISWWVNHCVYLSSSIRLNAS
jgi:hypothetical protein